MHGAQKVVPFSAFSSKNPVHNARFALMKRGSSDVPGNILLVTPRVVSNGLKRFGTVSEGFERDLGLSNKRNVRQSQASELRCLN